MSKLRKPSEDQIRAAWIRRRWEVAGQLRSEGSDDEFDLFIAEVKAQALKEAAHEFDYNVGVSVSDNFELGELHQNEFVAFLNERADELTKEKP